MKVTKLITLATFAVLALNASAKDFSSEELQQRMVERHAVDAVVWGAPAVTLATPSSSFSMAACLRLNSGARLLKSANPIRSSW